MKTPHKHAALLEALAKDEDAIFHCPAFGHQLIDVVLKYPSYPWTLVEKPDPYAELKEAYKAGKTVQVAHQDIWTDWNFKFEPSWALAEKYYRIKPETEPEEKKYLHVFVDGYGTRLSEYSGDGIGYLGKIELIQPKDKIEFHL